MWPNIPLKFRVAHITAALIDVERVDLKRVIEQSCRAKKGVCVCRNAGKRMKGV